MDLPFTVHPIEFREQHKRHFPDANAIMNVTIETPVDLGEPQISVKFDAPVIKAIMHASDLTMGSAISGHLGDVMNMSFANRTFRQGTVLTLTVYSKDPVNVVSVIAEGAAVH
jgi:hypothetical protein